MQHATLIFLCILNHQHYNTIRFTSIQIDTLNGRYLLLESVMRYFSESRLTVLLWIEWDILLGERSPNTEISELKSSFETLRPQIHSVFSSIFHFWRHFPKVKVKNGILFPKRIAGFFVFISFCIFTFWTVSH